VAQVRPGVLPVSVPPSPARPTMKGRGVPGGFCPAALVLRPAGPAGRPSASWRSETWPGGFAQAGQSRGPGTDRPGSSFKALLRVPRPRVTPGGDTYATRPEVRVRRGYLCRVVCPLGARASSGRGSGGPTSESPGFAPHLRAQPEGHRAPRGCFSPRALHVVPDSEKKVVSWLEKRRFHVVSGVGFNNHEVLDAFEDYLPQTLAAGN
jgi:hypothetical protein